jgi:hypothetical protein
MLAATILVACAADSPPHPSGGGESASDAISAAPDSSIADYDRLFIEIHSELSARLGELEKSGRSGTRLAEIQSIVKTAEEFYLEGKPLVAIRLLTEAELLLRQAP